VGVCGGGEGVGVVLRIASLILIYVYYFSYYDD
jgi:hypothetical protein